MEKKNRLLLITLNICAIIMLTFTLISTTLAYFKFSTYYFSEGNLPILKLHANVESINGNALAEILYLGQNEKVEVKFSTAGNNVAGKLRVSVVFVWDNQTLKNNPQNSSGETILAATVELFNPELFRAEGNTFYLKENFEKDTEIVFTKTIKFAEDLPNEYLGHKVKVYILADLIQTNKEW